MWCFTYFKTINTRAMTGKRRRYITAGSQSKSFIEDWGRGRQAEPVTSDRAQESETIPSITQPRRRRRLSNAKLSADVCGLTLPLQFACVDTNCQSLAAYGYQPSAGKLMGRKPIAESAQSQPT